MAGKVRITLIKSPHKRTPKQRKTIEALGLRKIRQAVEREKNQVLLGMIRKVSHMVEVEEIT
jgi:large subunit ribosomal protein L30